MTKHFHLGDPPSATILNFPLTKRMRAIRRSEGLTPCERDFAAIVTRDVVYFMLHMWLKDDLPDIFRGDEIKALTFDNALNFVQSRALFHSVTERLRSR